MSKGGSWRISTTSTAAEVELLLRPEGEVVAVFAPHLTGFAQAVTRPPRSARSRTW
jgi:hypothetical protein